MQAQMDVQTIVNLFVYGAPGACMVLGIIAVMMGDALKPLGETALAIDGWIFFFIGLGVYIIELILYYHSQSG